MPGLLDPSTGSRYCRGVGTGSSSPAGLPGLIPPRGKFRRRPPNPAEQERRVAWGRKQGYLNREAINQAMERAA